MTREKELEQLKTEYAHTPIPPEGLGKMEEAIRRAKQERSKPKKMPLWKRTSVAIAAALVLAVLLPNMNANIAMAMEKIPVIGDLIKVVTFHRYDFQDNDREATVEVPQIETDLTDSPEPETAQGSIDQVNQDITAYTDQIIEQFTAGLSEEDKKALDIRYEVLTDTDSWFALRLDVLEIQASGYQYSKFYNIDKITGKQAELKDLFRDGADYITPLSENIKEQMRSQMQADESKIYFLDDTDTPETNFTAIRADQGFYLDDNGDLHIAFDEYEVAPGFMGQITFQIPKEAIAGIRK